MVEKEDKRAIEAMTDGLNFILVKKVYFKSVAKNSGLLLSQSKNNLCQKKQLQD